MIDYLKNVLNKQQFEASQCVDGASLILAGAWSWKTRTLTYKIAYMTYIWINPWNILAVTFTNKAAKEMKERLQELDKEIESLSKPDNYETNDSEINKKAENIKEYSQDDIMQWPANDEDSMISEDFIDSCLKDYDWNNWKKTKNYERIGTFHSIFLKILKYDINEINDILNSNYDRNFNISDEWDALRIIRKILKDLWVKDVFTPKEAKWKISAFKNKWLTAKESLYEANDDNDEMISKIYQKYEKELREQNTLDFDDLLLIPYLILKNKKNILEKWQDKFQYILVDEAQDTNKIQFDLIYMLSTKNGNITLIWDDFQSIYGWRWAVIDEFLNAHKYWPNIKIFKLEINYRSKKTIVDAWNAIISNNKDQYKKNIQAHEQKESKIKIISFPTEDQEAVHIVELIKKLKQKWKKWSDFAFIYRTNAQSEPIEKVLLTENIPYKIYGWFKFYERKEVKDILSYIKYLINPSDGISLSRIINTPSRKIWITTINKLLDSSNLENISLNDIIKNIDNTNISSWAKKNIKWFNEIIKYIKEKIQDQTPKKSIDIIVKAIKYENYLKKEYSEEESKERMWNIWQLMNVSSNFEKTWLEALRLFIDEISLFVDLEEKLEDQKDEVQLMTIHSSKWLEFDTVFLTGLEENIFPLSRARLNPKQLEEERRLMYVWVTRAKNNLFLTYSESRKQYWNLKYNPVSRFVEEIPENLVSAFNSKSKNKQHNFEVHDKVKHKLFGVGTVMEVFQDKIIVRFPRDGIRQILAPMLEKFE